MIQFNLLPDVKLEFIKAERIKHAVISGAVIATSVTLAIFLLLFVTVHIVQRQIMSAQTSDIKKLSKELKDTPDLDKILTIQNQLKSIGSLHGEKPATIRTFGLVQQVTPKSVSLTELSVDFETMSYSVSGLAPALSDANTMVDTFKYVKYKADGLEEKNVFKDVVMSEFSKDSKQTSFTITATYDPEIYNNVTGLAFIVPNAITTRSVQELPQLFTKPAGDTDQ